MTANNGSPSDNEKSMVSPSMQRLIREGVKSTSRIRGAAALEVLHSLHNAEPIRSTTTSPPLQPKNIRFATSVGSQSPLLMNAEDKVALLETHVSELESRYSSVQRQLKSTAQSLTGICMLFYRLVNEMTSGDLSVSGQKNSVSSRATKIILDYVTPVRQASEALLDMWSHFYYRGDLSLTDSKHNEGHNPLIAEIHQLAPTPKVPPPPCPPNQTATHLHGHYEPEGPEFRRGLQNFALTSSFSRDYWLFEAWIATAAEEPLDITGARENIPTALSQYFNVHPQRIRELETDIRKERIIVMTLCLADIDDPSALSGIDLLVNLTEAGKDPGSPMWSSNDWLYEYSQRITFKPVGLAEATLERLAKLEAELAEQREKQIQQERQIAQLKREEGGADVGGPRQPDADPEVVADLRRQLKAALRRNDKLEEELRDAHRKAAREADSVRSGSMSSGRSDVNQEYVKGLEEALDREHERVVHLERELEAAVRAAQRVTHDKKVRKALESELTNIRADKERHRREREVMMERVTSRRRSQRTIEGQQTKHVAKQGRSSDNADRIAQLESLLHQALSYSYVAVKLYSITPIPNSAGWGLEMFYAQLSTPDSSGTVDSQGAMRGDWQGRVLFLPYTEGMTFTVNVTCVWRTAQGEPCRQEGIGRTEFIRVVHPRSYRTAQGDNDDETIDIYPLRRSTNSSSSIYTDDMSLRLGVYCCIAGDKVQHIKTGLGTDPSVSSRAPDSLTPSSSRSSSDESYSSDSSSGVGPRPSNPMRHPPVALPLNPFWNGDHYEEARCDTKTASRKANFSEPSRLDAIQRGSLVVLQGTCCYVNQKEEFSSETYVSLAAFGDTVYPAEYDKEQMDLNRRNYISEKSPHVPFCIVEVAQSTGSVKALHIDCCDRVSIDGRVAIDLSMCHHTKHRKLFLPQRPPIYLGMAASSAFDKNVFLCGFVDVEQEGNFEPLLLCSLEGFADPAIEEHSHRRRSVSGFDDETAIMQTLEERTLATWHGAKEAGQQGKERIPKPSRKLVYATCSTEEEYGIVHVVIDDDGCVWMRTDDRLECERRLWLPALPFTRDVHEGDSCQKVLSLCSGFKHRSEEYGHATATRSGGVVVIEGCIGNTRDYADISARHAALPIKVACLPSGFRPARYVRFLTASDILDLVASEQPKHFSVDTCDSSLHGPRCSFSGGSHPSWSLPGRYANIMSGIIPQTLIDSSSDPTRLHSKVNILLRYMDHSEPLQRRSDVVAFLLDMRATTYTDLPANVSVHYDERWLLDNGKRPVMSPGETAGLITFSRNITVTSLVIECPSPVVVQGLSGQRIQWEGHAKFSPLQSRADMIGQSLLISPSRSTFGVSADATSIDELRLFSLDPVTLYTVEGRIGTNASSSSHSHHSLVLEKKGRNNRGGLPWLGQVADAADYVDMNFVSEHGLHWSRSPTASDVDLTRGLITYDIYSEIVTMARPSAAFFKLSQHVSRVVLSSWGKSNANSEDSIIEAAVASTTEQEAITEYLRWAATSRNDRENVTDDELLYDELAVRKDMKEILDVIRARFRVLPINGKKSEKKPVTVSDVGYAGELSATVKELLSTVSGDSQAVTSEKAPVVVIYNSKDLKDDEVELARTIESQLGIKMVYTDSLVDAIQTMINEATGLEEDSSLFVETGEDSLSTALSEELSESPSGEPVKSEEQIKWQSTSTESSDPT
ncbi:hypothetical protein FOL47_011027 [Perkinsus chesapeaki]|uniref:Uncharacterized protein n=1 Tax=Perkinsus chesapeaki TaxID=330153 RepID=A0A7J6MP32_PERCH|nr:hypothetical protein FOL47_011027 [Perkinsus chesapeaki]